MLLLKKLQMTERKFQSYLMPTKMQMSLMYTSYVKYQAVPMQMDQTRSEDSFFLYLSVCLFLELMTRV